MSAKLMIAALERCALRHGEKVGLGAALFLVGMAGLQTDWRTYRRSPEEILDRVAAARTELVGSGWPEAERAAFLAGGRLNPRDAVERSLHHRIPVALYSASQRLQQRPGPGFWALSDPEFGIVENLEADGGRALLRLAAVVDADDAAVVEAADVDKVPDEFQPRGGRSSGNTNPVPIRAPVTNNSAAQRAQEVSLRGRAYPLVSVRGVFDVNAQIRAYIEALHKGYSACAKDFEILDFHLERQELLAGADFWSDWRPVDVQVYYDVVSDCDGLETDVISGDVIDSAITCPLPARWTGRWNALATHPRLADFELSDEELAREVAYLKALADEIRRQNPVRNEGIQKKGFTDLVGDAHELTDVLLGSAAAAPRTERPFGIAPAARPEEDLVRRLTLDMDPRQTDRELREWVRQRANAARDLLLFRYLDFDVDPGATYRYRVRLELRNPNYGRPLALAGGAAHVIEGATRLTSWSEPTPPVYVEATTSAFLTRVETPRARPYPEALMQLFQYDLQTGTTVHQELPVACGQFVGGEAVAMVIDPVRGIVEDRAYTFHSDDVLVDGLADLSFPLSEHPDLALPANSRRRAGSTEYAVLVDEHNRLRTLDPVAQRAALRVQEQRMVWQDELFESFRSADDAAEAPGNEYVDLYKKLYGVPESGGSMHEAARPRNPLSGN